MKNFMALLSILVCASSLAHAGTTSKASKLKEKKQAQFVCSTQATPSLPNYDFSEGTYYVAGTQTEVALSQCSSVNGVIAAGQVTKSPCVGTYYAPAYGRWGVCEQMSYGMSNCSGMIVVSESGQQVVCE